MNVGSKLRTGPPVKVLEEPFKSIAQFECWKHSVAYNLRLDPDFKPYLKPNVVFGKKSRAAPNRALQTTGTGDDRVTAEEKCDIVDMMLMQISNFCPTIPHNDIVKDCASLNEVWQTIRLHSNIESSGALLNDCFNITRNSSETPQQLYSRLKQAYDDSLIKANSLKYRDAVLAADEELSPTLHCSIILHWLQLLHPGLRDLVTQRFGTELRGASYAAIFPEISRSVDSLMKELTGADASSVCRYDESFSNRARGSYSRSKPSTRSSQGNSARSCDYCRITGRRAYATHSIDDCRFLKHETTKSSYGSSRAMEDIDEHYEEFTREYPGADSRLISVTTHIVNRVTLSSSPVLPLQHRGKDYNLTIDTGGTCSILDDKTADAMGCEIHPTSQRAKMADGGTELDVIGETTVELHRPGESKVYTLNALVCRVFDHCILAGMPFLESNDVGVRPALHQILIEGKPKVTYKPQTSAGRVRRVSNYTIHSSARTVLLPGESTVHKLPESLGVNMSVAVEPRIDSSHNRSSSELFPKPQVYDVKDGTVKLENTTSEPVLIKKHEQICIVQSPVCQEDVQSSLASAVVVESSPGVSVCHSKSVAYSTPAKICPDGEYSPEQVADFTSLVRDYDELFNPQVGTYNGKAGELYVEVNMGPSPPPQHKGRTPFYGRSNMNELDDKFDELLEKKVLARPQDVGVNVEIVNPSFLVRKSNSTDKRLVTDFGQISGYCRPTPTKMPNVDDTLRQIAAWSHLGKTDFSTSYYQLLLRQSSQKYCGVVSPTKGVLVYTRGCMGLPGTEVALEELTSLLFGKLVRQGKVAKLADDLFVGGNSPQELRDNLEEVFGILLENGLRLSAKKTVIAPKSCVILGWLWSRGFLKATPHRLSALGEVKPPQTVSAMKSFLGAYRFLSRVIKNYASLLKPLEEMIAGKAGSTSSIKWSEDELAAFGKAQAALKDPKTIILPRASDTLWIVTDAAVRPTAVGATLYAVRDGKSHLGGFYNAKLPPFQSRWLPCELEGVAIGLSLKHFAPYIIQSEHRVCVLTDSKACVEAVQRFRRGELSSSARLMTFISAVSAANAEIKHISGASNIFSDFVSRNPVQCDDFSCQICKFVKDSVASVVAAISVSDVLAGRVQLPFGNKKAWYDIQQECPDLRRVYNYLQNGTSPGKKGRNLKLVRRYISAKVMISSEGTLVVRLLEPLQPVKERIVIPQQSLHGILTVLHLRLGHPTAGQMHKVFIRQFFALQLDSAIAAVSKSCHQCEALREVPKALVEQSTDAPPERVGQMFAADIIKRHRQLILVLRECVSSYTVAEFIERETAAEVSAGLLRLCNLVRPAPFVPISIRVDPAPGNRSIFLDIRGNDVLKAQNIHLVIGRELNKNKNPVSEKAIRELIREMLILSPEAVQITSSILSQAVANLNSRIRATGMSAHEVHTQRDQASGVQLCLDDGRLIEDQHQRRNSNHKFSEVSKAGFKPPRPAAVVKAGDIVYLYSESSKEKARPRYLVLTVNGRWCKLRRLADKRLGARTYDAKVEEIFKVPDEMDISLPASPVDDEDDDAVFKIIPPSQPDPVKFPCCVCHAEVRDGDEALCCDTCSQWCHISCGHVPRMEYRRLQKEGEFPWVCPVHPQVSGSESSSDSEDEEHDEVEEVDVLPLVTELPPLEVVPSVEGRPVRSKKAPDFLGVDASD